jgi:replication-associated recombination protein RarA
VGQAGKVAEVLMRKAERLKANPDQPIKLIISGAPGIGKTSLVNLIARTLASHPVSIEDVNGKEVGLELAREWTRSLAYGSVFGSWSVKVVNELDRCSKDAQDMLLTYLDRMKPGHAFLGTTNLDLGSLTERFQTRFQSVRLQPPENEVLAAFLARRWGAPIGITRQISEGARGNVRAAMADLEVALVQNKLNSRPRKCLDYATPNDIFAAPPPIALAA